MRRPARRAPRPPPTVRARLALHAGLALLAPLACGDATRGTADRPDPASVPEEERFGGTVVVAGASDLESMNSLVSSDFHSHQHQIHVLFLTLVRHDPALVEQPWLARSWEVSPDTSEIVFHLREDGRWHDGTPVTAADVAFTFDRAKDPEVPFANRGYFDRWESAEVLDDHTLRFVIRPHASFLYGWAVTAIMPRHLLAGAPPARLAADPFGTVRPVGAGPFQFSARVPGERWTFEAAEEFPAGLGGRPYLDRVVYRVIAEPGTAIAELQTGGVDVALDVPPDLLGRVARDSALAVAEFPSPSYTFIAWNTRRPYFAAPELRRALTLAIDRGQIVEAVRGGLGEVAAGPVGPWHPAFDARWAPIPFAPDSAAAILERAGWRDRDGDGVREKDGVRFAFDLLTNEMAERRDIAVIVQAALARIGVEARPRVRESGALRDAVTSPDRRYDAVVLSWVRDVILDDRDLWSCDQLGQPLQFTGWCDPALDPVLDSIPIVADPERRRALIGRYHQAVVRGQPYTFLYYETRADAYRRALQGFAPDIRGDWAAARSWWLLPGARRGPG